MICAELSQFERRLLGRLLTNPRRLHALLQQSGYDTYLRDLLARQRQDLLATVQRALQVPFQRSEA